MISIIVCSVNQEFYNCLNQSVIKTIDIPFEIILIDNNLVNLSISQAYNKGAQMSRYDYLLFVHEDVEFINSGWGKKIIKLLQDISIGIIGIAGSTYLPSVPSGWYLPFEHLNQVFVHQGFKYIEAPVRFDNQGDDLTTVYLLDGVFLSMRKDVWKEFPFDEKLEGFHAYDVDISQRVSSKYQNFFTKQIEILHKSEGKVDKTYFDAILKYKNANFSFKYPKRDFKIELELLKQYYSNIRCFYEKKECISKIKSYHSFQILHIKGYFKFKKFLKYAK